MGVLWSDRGDAGNRRDWCYPSSASKAEKEAWILGYLYIVELDFDSGSLRTCAVTWPRVYGLKRGVVK